MSYNCKFTLLFQIGTARFVRTDYQSFTSLSSSFYMIICLLLTQLLILQSQITSTNFIAQWKFMAKTLSLKMQCNHSRFIQENYTWGENRSINSGATGCLGGLTFTRNCNPRLPLKSVNSDLVFFVVDRYVPLLFLALWVP